jgi:hypothetical protein
LHTFSCLFSKDISQPFDYFRAMTRSAAILCLTALFLCGVVSSCGSMKGFSLGGGNSGGAFLKTKDAKLSAWLDERFKIDYKYMTPQLIFDQVPLNDVYYETSNLPTSATPFTFSSEGDLSRRELLQKIADHWGLKMSLGTDMAGTVTAIKVEG